MLLCQPFSLHHRHAEGTADGPGLDAQERRLDEAMSDIAAKWRSNEEQSLNSLPALGLQHC
jgi:hypothetical protein